MAIEEVKKYFSRFNMEDKIKELENSSATVELAALALNVELQKPYLLWLAISPF